MNRKPITIYHLSFLLLLLASCEIINPEEDIPTFIEINDFQLSTTAAQGSDQHQINDVWAFVGGEPLGIFELPATIPVLEAGEQTITLIAGIRDNGLRSTPAIYPFYDRFETTLSLVPGETTIIEPALRYISNSVFELVEDFETNNLLLSGAIQRTTNSRQVKEGTGSGSILLTNSEATVQSSFTFLELPTSGALPVYLEMDYKTNVDLEVGLIGLDVSSSPNPFVNFKVILSPINRWNKVYINFLEDLTLFPREGYQLAFRVTNSSNTATPEILLDNIKLIRFQP